MKPRPPFILWSTAAALLLVAVCLMKPTADIGYTVHRYLFVIDITESMNVADVTHGEESISRLQLVKLGLRRALQELHCDSEVALAIFTEHRSFLLITPIPICANFAELDNIIDHIDWRMAWRSKSEVSKGLSSAIRINEAIEDRPTVVFFTDGHESPPIHPDLRLKVKEPASGRGGLLVGVGGDELRPIPKLDGRGNKIGYWHPDEVEQVDRYTAAVREGQSITGVPPNPLYTGKEHLSRLKEGYLQEIAREASYQYLRLESPGDLARALKNSEYGEAARSVQDIRSLLLLAALLVFLSGYGSAVNPRRWALKTAA